MIIIQSSTQGSRVKATLCFERFSPSGQSRFSLIGFNTCGNKIKSCNLRVCPLFVSDCLICSFIAFFRMLIGGNGRAA